MPFSWSDAADVKSERLGQGSRNGAQDGPARPAAPGARRTSTRAARSNAAGGHGGGTTLSNRASTRLSPVHGVRAVRNDQELQLALSASTRLSGHSCVAHGAELHAAKHMIISSARLLACITRGKPCGVGGGQRIT